MASKIDFFLVYGKIYIGVRAELVLGWEFLIHVKKDRVIFFIQIENKLGRE